MSLRKSRRISVQNENIEEILKENNPDNSIPSLRVTSSRLNKPLPMSTLLQTLPEEGLFDLEDHLHHEDIGKPTGLSQDSCPSAASNVVFGFQTPSKKKGRQSLLQIAVTSSAQKRGQQYLDGEKSPPPLDQDDTQPSCKKTPTRGTSKKSPTTPQQGTPSSRRQSTTTTTTPRGGGQGLHILRTPQCVPKTYKDGASTPRSRRSLAPLLDQEGPPPTPKHIRAKIKTRIMEVGDDTDYGGDSSDDSDNYSEDLDDSDMDKDYRPDVSQASASPGRDSSPDASLLSDEETTTHRGSAKKRSSSAPKKGPLRKKRLRADVGETTSNSDYFLHNDGSGARGATATSDHTLSRLAVPRLSSAVVHSLIAKMKVDHEQERQALYDEHCQLFEKWMTLLSYGYSVFCHGVGSKKNLLSQFQEEHLHSSDHIVVNGFFPSLTAISILSNIADEIMCLDKYPSALAELLDIIYKHYSSPGVSPLYIVVHNIDGAMMRGRKCQQVLAHLCSLPSVGLVASVDHINAPLVLDSRRVAEYNVLWFDCTTLAPYVEETSYENSLVQQSAGLAIASLNFVFKSLTPSAKSIFIELAQYQLTKQQDSSEGMTFTALYQRCREAMLVNSELTLNAQLTEFRDHKLIRQRKGYDGAEVLTIPLAAGPLKDFVEQYNEGAIDG